MPYQAIENHWGIYDKLLLNLRGVARSGYDALPVLRGVARFQRNVALIVRRSALYGKRAVVFYRCSNRNAVCRERAVQRRCIFSTAIKAGLGQPNIITVIAIGSTLNFYVNRQFVSTVQDSSSASGAIGLLGRTPGRATLISALPTR
jgi:hypothetical protein